jgi:6-phosphogluconolactonase
MAHFELRRFPSDDALAQYAAGLWVTEVDAAARRGKHHVVALSGGRIALKFFQATAVAARKRNVGFSHVHFFWADERCVPPDNPESNYGVAHRLLLQPLGATPGQIHRLRGEEPQGVALAAAIAELRGIAPASESGVPVFDLILLGMGEDGHVASLFPNEAKSVTASADVYRGVVAVKPPPRRLTLGYGVITASRATWVLASGAGKEVALRESLKPGGHTPLGRVLEARSSTLIFSDITGI